MSRRLSYRVSQAFVLGYHRLVLGYKVHGLENVPLDGACLLASNHISYLDPPAVGAPIPREICYFAKRELFDIPILGSVIRNFGAMPVDRAAFDKSTLKQAIQILRSGRALLVFPEGTRVRKPGLGPVKDGIAMLALMANAPVLPVWIGHTWEPERTLFRRIPVEVRYGPPLHFEPLEKGEDRRVRYSEVTDRVMAAIGELGNGLSEPHPDRSGARLSN